MILCDVNVMLYAFREESRDFSAYNGWFNNVLNSDEAYGVADIVLSSFLRIVTHPKIYKTPTSLKEALQFVGMVRSQPHAVGVSPGPHHWDIFTGLCEKTEAKGSIMADAYLAALAIESGSEWVTTDRDYARFPGLRWRHPLKG